MTQFDAVWEVIKGWDIERKPGEGYAHATGSDVDAILKAFWEADTEGNDMAANKPLGSSDVANPQSSPQSPNHSEGK